LAGIFEPVIVCFVFGGFSAKPDIIGCTENNKTFIISTCEIKKGRIWLL
jgi:hypothetical protein